MTGEKEKEEGVPSFALEEGDDHAEDGEPVNVVKNQP